MTSSIGQGPASSSKSLCVGAGKDDESGSGCWMAACRRRLCSSGTILVVIARDDEYGAPHLADARDGVEAVPEQRTGRQKRIVHSTHVAQRREG